MNTILIVDDEPVVRQPLAIALRLQSYRVHVAAGAEEALALLAGEPPDLVILDIDMPTVDGIQLLARIRAEPKTADVPAIMLTNSAKPDLVSEAFRTGADDYLLKSAFSLESLLTRVARLLRDGSSRALLHKPSDTVAELLALRTPDPPRVVPPTTKDLTGHVHAASEETAILPRVPVALGREESLRRVRACAEKHRCSGTLAAIMRITASDDSTRRELVDLIGQDAQLASRVLGAANTAGSARRAVSLGTVDEAVHLIGFGTVRKLAVTIGLFGSVRAKPVASFHPVHWLRHGLTAAAVAERLGRIESDHGAADYLVAFCSILGELVVREALGAECAMATVLAQEEHISLVDAERKTLGATRSELAKSAYEWLALPDEVTQLVETFLSQRGTHHDAAPAGSRQRRLHLAKAYATALLACAGEDDAVFPLWTAEHSEIAPLTGLDWSRTRSESAAATALVLTAIGSTDVPPPAFTQTVVTVAYVRAPASIPNDPLSVALASLCRPTERDQAPRTREEWGACRGLVIVRNRKLETARWANDLEQAIASRPGRSPILVVDASSLPERIRQAGVLAVPGSPTMATLASFVGAMR